MVILHLTYKQKSSNKLLYITLFKIYQEKHALLVALPRQLLQAAFSDELSVVLHDVVHANQVPLQLDQLLLKHQFELHNNAMTSPADFQVV